MTRRKAPFIGSDAFRLVYALSYICSTKVCQVLVQHWRSQGHKALTLWWWRRLSKLSASKLRLVINCSHWCAEVRFSPQWKEQIWTISACALSRVHFGSLWQLHVCHTEKNGQILQLSYHARQHFTSLNRAHDLARIAGSLIWMSPALGPIARLRSRSIYHAISCVLISTLL